MRESEVQDSGWLVRGCGTHLKVSESFPIGEDREKFRRRRKGTIELPCEACHQLHQYHLKDAEVFIEPE